MRLQLCTILFFYFHYLEYYEHVTHDNLALNFGIPCEFYQKRNYISVVNMNNNFTAFI